MSEWSDNFSEAGLNDLEIGQRILIMGTENSDGSVTASQIIIGENETIFSQLSGNRAQQELNEDDIGNSKDKRSMDRSKDQISNFQNLSQEERMGFMKERGVSGVRRDISANISQNIIRLSGEIISIDNISLTLKLETSGSKIIFISDTTNVNIIKL